MNLKDTPAADYEADFALWLESQLALLRTRQFDNLDVENLSEELGGILRSAHRELKRRLEIIMLHLLKCEFQVERKGARWIATLNHQRSAISLLIEESPSLDRNIAAYALQRYRHAVHSAASETSLAPSLFPPALPYSTAQLLDPDFIP